MCPPRPFAQPQNSGKGSKSHLGKGRNGAETQIVRIQLTGWKAIVALVLILGASRLCVYSRSQTVSDRGREALREGLAKVYTGRGPKALAQRVAAYRQGVPDALDLPTVRVPQIEFASASAHGSSGARIVQAEISRQRVIVESPSPDSGASALGLHAANLGAALVCQNPR